MPNHLYSNPLINPGRDFMNKSKPPNNLLGMEIDSEQKEELMI